MDPFGTARSHDSAKRARWLTLPLLYTAGQWGLLLRTSQVLQFWPFLWTCGGKGVSDVLIPYPKTKLQAFDLGWHASIFASRCRDPSLPLEELPAECREPLQNAASALGVQEPLTPKQLMEARALLKELDEQRSVVDRVMGFFSFVNFLWACSIIGVLVTVVPCIAMVFGPALVSFCATLAEHVILPLVRILHHVGAFELMAWLVAYTFCVQSARYPASQASAAAMVALTGGLAFLPCWFYSTALHVESSDGSKQAFVALTLGLLTAALVPLAVLHQSSLLGFAAVMALYGSLGFVCGAFGLGFFIGFEGKDEMQRCTIASVILVLLFSTLRISAAPVSYLQPFATAAMVFGSVMYFLSLLIQSSIMAAHSQSERKTYLQVNALMLASLLVALFVGHVYGIPSMSNTATVFFVLYGLEKELEYRHLWGDLWIVALFANFVALYYVAHYLNTHPGLVLSLFDPSGIYLA